MYLNMLFLTALFIVAGLPSSVSTPLAPPSPDISSSFLRSSSSDSASVFLRVAVVFAASVATGLSVYIPYPALTFTHVFGSFFWGPEEGERTVTSSLSCVASLFERSVLLVPMATVVYKAAASLQGGTIARVRKIDPVVWVNLSPSRRGTIIFRALVGRK